MVISPRQIGIDETADGSDRIRGPKLEGGNPPACDPSWRGGRVGAVMPDNPSTELALIHLIRDEIHQLRDRLTQIEHQTQHRHQELMTALETLTEAVAKGTAGQAELTTAVNAAIVRLGNPGATDAQLLTLASAIDALSASDVSLTAALTAALNPVPPPTP